MIIRNTRVKNAQGNLVYRYVDLLRKLDVYKLEPIYIYLLKSRRPIIHLHTNLEYMYVVKKDRTLNIRDFS